MEQTLTFRCAVKHSPLFRTQTWPPSSTRFPITLHDPTSWSLLYCIASDCVYFTLSYFFYLSCSKGFCRKRSGHEVSPTLMSSSSLCCMSISMTQVHLPGLALLCPPCAGSMITLPTGNGEVDYSPHTFQYYVWGLILFITFSSIYQVVIWSV